MLMITFFYDFVFWWSFFVEFYFCDEIFLIFVDDNFFLINFFDFIIFLLILFLFYNFFVDFNFVYDFFLINYFFVNFSVFLVFGDDLSLKVIDCVLIWVLFLTPRVYLNTRKRKRFILWVISRQELLWKQKQICYF